MTPMVPFTLRLTEFSFVFQHELRRQSIRPLACGWSQRAEGQTVRLDIKDPSVMKEVFFSISLSGSDTFPPEALY